MIQIHNALADYLVQNLPDVDVAKRFVLSNELDELGGSPRVIVVPTEAGIGEKSGQARMVARGFWTEVYSFAITFIAKTPTDGEVEPMAALAGRIMPLFPALRLPGADVICVGVDKPAPYFKSSLHEERCFVAPHIVSFRRDCEIRR